MWGGIRGGMPGGIGGIPHWGGNGGGGAIPGIIGIIPGRIDGIDGGGCGNGGAPVLWPVGDICDWDRNRWLLFCRNDPLKAVKKRWSKLRE